MRHTNYQAVSVTWTGLLEYSFLRWVQHIRIQLEPNTESHPRTAERTEIQEKGRSSIVTNYLKCVDMSKITVPAKTALPPQRVVSIKYDKIAANNALSANNRHTSENQNDKGNKNRQNFSSLKKLWYDLTLKKDDPRNISFSNSRCVFLVVIRPLNNSK